jgi:hypothetical protein
MVRSANPHLAPALISISAAALLSVIALAAAQTTRPERSPGDAFEPPSPASSAKLHPALARGLSDASGPVKAWIFFTDKGLDSPAASRTAVQAVAASYDPRAVRRRMLRGQSAREGGALFDERDLPVAQAYLDAVATTGARVHVASRWLNAVSAYVTAEQAARIAERPFVRRLQPVAWSRRIVPLDVRPQGGGRFPTPPSGGPRDGLDYGDAADQLNQINLVALHNQGYTADGVIIGVLDTGFQRTHAAFNNPSHPVNVLAEWDFVNNDGNTAIESGDPGGQHAHGTMILGVLGAYQPGSLVGGAYNASFVLCKTEDITQEVPAEEDNYVAGLEFIENHGGDMTTSSLGYIDWYTQADLDGQTAVTTIAVNIASSLGVHCCTAAGNGHHDDNPGTSHLIAPADAFRVLTCGAVDAAGIIAGFSSDGPTADGRVKPELLARGVGTFTVSPWDNLTYATVSGTSLSTPLLACAVACLTQAHPDWTVDQMRSALMNSAADFIANGTYDPLFVRGYGIVNAYAAAQDCNGNGLPDLLDISTQTSGDCDADGVPDECEWVPGDVNCDCAVDADDIAPFVLALTDPAAYQGQFPRCNIERADADADASIDGRDIKTFVGLLLP